MTEISLQAVGTCYNLIQNIYLYLGEHCETKLCEEEEEDEPGGGGVTKLQLYMGI